MPNFTQLDKYSHRVIMKIKCTGALKAFDVTQIRYMSDVTQIRLCQIR